MASKEEMQKRYDELCDKDDKGDNLTDKEITESVGLYYWLNGYKNVLSESQTPFDVWGVPGPDTK